MTASRSALTELLTAVVGRDRCRYLMRIVQIPPMPVTIGGGSVDRSVIAQALNMLLFEQLVDDVPAAARFVAEAAEPIVLDHGAVRTVDGETGALPAGWRSIATLLEPLGFAPSGEYPLDKLAMTGHALTHLDAPTEIAQFFVSELHVDRLPGDARTAAARVFGRSRDPVGAELGRNLDRLAHERSLPLSVAAALLRDLIPCFGRQHPLPQLADYETLLAHSPELAWIATEGNRFNHATARVADVEMLADALVRLGYDMKAAVEVSRAGSVRQTALRAAPVERQFVDGAAIVTRAVPGAFFEFITRGTRHGLDGAQLDLRFDSGNAQGIFQMTRSARRAV